MIVDINKLPKKSQHKKRDIEKVIVNSKDKLYEIIKIEYPSGLIRFEHLMICGLFINYYTTSGTITIEFRKVNCINRQYHSRKLNFKSIND